MGAQWTSLLPRPAAARTPPLTALDALALCEAGDLLLIRESLQHRALRLRLELAVARDVGRAQRGRSPQQLITALPVWTSCELLVRHSGELLVLSARADGVHLTPFMDRVQDGDRLAVRRLQRGVSTALLRELCDELAPAAPVRWQQLLDGHSEPSVGPQHRQQAPPLVASVLTRALELWKASMTASGQAAPPINAGALETQDADTSDALSMLGAALVAAVYERLGVLSHEAARPPLMPTNFSTRVQGAVDPVEGPSGLVFMPPEALGVEIRLEGTATPST